MQETRKTTYKVDRECDKNYAKEYCRGYHSVSRSERVEARREARERQTGLGARTEIILRVVVELLGLHVFASDGKMASPFGARCSRCLFGN